jgi:hypothetical protein
LLQLISLAQHYEYRSIMIDVTKDIDCAIWFATHEWDTGELAGSADGSPGVIYRFDRAKIAELMQNHLTGPGAMPPPAITSMGIFGHADISEQFDFLKRPRAQQGGSLLGMENFLTHFLIKLYGGATVFEFDHTTVKDIQIHRTRDDICPPNDSGLDIFRPSDRFSPEPIPWMDFETALTVIQTIPAERRAHFITVRRAGAI